MSEFDELCVNAVRVLAIESIEKAKSGHPGIALGAAASAFALWSEHMVFNPKDPSFFNRDRFVLSAGHGSAMLYSLLHIFGYDVTREDLMNFRQFESRTPGHPEIGVTAGVEVSTGPLGQGFANAVGIALAEKSLAARFNKEDLKIVNHNTYALVGDGCLMEGISYEAASLAGTWELNKLIVLYDSNNICIEGSTNTVFTEDVAMRFKACGWHIERVEDGNDLAQISAAIARCKKQSKKPSLIEIKSTIGYASPFAASEKSHGSPLGAENVQKTRQALGWTSPAFTAPDEVFSHCAAKAARGVNAQANWESDLEKYAQKYADDYEQFIVQTQKKPDLKQIEKLLDIDYKADATRNIGGIVLNKIASALPNLVGGTADLSPSTKASINGGGNFCASNPTGRNILFGVREHAMGAICNGIWLHGGFNVFCSTFFVFSDYMKGAIRMSALMNIPALFVLTHDSIGVGEDGPTHQPIEQLASLRTIPNLNVFRPADGRETAAAYLSWLKGKPTAVVLSRQALPVVDSSSIEKAQRGGYVVADDKNPQAIIIASGSEVAIALGAREILRQKNVRVRVVSMPSIELFEAESIEYKESVLLKSVRNRLTIEAAHTSSLAPYAGLDGASMGINTFGISGPAHQVFNHFNFTPEFAANQVLALIESNK